MKAATYRALERIFVVDVEGRWPLQSKAAIYTELESEGLVERVERIFGGDRFGAVVVTGWAFTIPGHMAYCEEASRRCELSGELAS